MSTPRPDYFSIIRANFILRFFGKFLGKSRKRKSGKNWKGKVAEARGGVVRKHALSLSTPACREPTPGVEAGEGGRPRAVDCKEM